MNRKLWLLITMGVVGLAHVLSGIPSGQFMETTLEASAIPGTGTLSGTVEAPKPFKAAQVYARNVDKNVLYMVYTAGGRYQAVNLFPGNYEVSAKTRGFEGDVKKVVVSVEKNTVVNLSLREASVEPLRSAGVAVRRTAKENVELVSYDALYPPGPGREVAERTCIICHGADFLPSHQWTEAQWNAAVDLMMSPGGPQGGTLIPPSTLSPKARQDLVLYLAKTFGPNSPKRGLEIRAEMPLDEQALAKAMYVEYYLPLDAMPDENHPQQLHDPHFDKDGNVWFTDIGASRVGKLDPRTGAFKEYRLPDPNLTPHGITVDAEGHIWWAEAPGLGRLDPKTGEMMHYPMGLPPKIKTRGHTPIIDSKQNVWFTAIWGNRLGKWDRKTEKITIWEPPTNNSFPYGLVVDKNDKLWMAEFRRCKIAKFDPVTEKFTEYSPLTTPCNLQRLGMDSKGTIWYGVGSAGKLGKLDPNTGQMVEYNIPMPSSHPYDVWPDREDNVWISDAGQGGALIQFDPRTEKFTYYPSPQRTDMPKMEITRYGAIWYCARSAENQAVGVLYPDVTKITTMAAYY